jgi:hypothetical protein
MIASAVYALCALTSLLCAGLLWRAYRTSGARLLLWSTAAFTLLALNSVLLFLDLVVFPLFDLAPYRALLAAAAVTVLLCGLIWDSR